MLFKERLYYNDVPIASTINIIDMGVAFLVDKSTQQIITDSIHFNFEFDAPDDQLCFFPINGTYDMRKGRTPNVVFEFYGLRFREDIPADIRTNFSSIMKATALANQGKNPGKYQPLPSYEPVLKMIEIGTRNFKNFIDSPEKTLRYSPTLPRDYKTELDKFFFNFTSVVPMESSSRMVDDIAASIEHVQKATPFGTYRTNRPDVTRKDFFQKKTNGDVAKDILKDPFTTLRIQKLPTSTKFYNWSVDDLKDVAQTYPANKLQELDPNVKLQDRQLIANIKWALDHFDDKTPYSFARMDVHPPIYKRDEIKGYKLKGDPNENVGTFSDFFTAGESLKDNLKGVKSCLIVDDNKRTANTQRAIHDLLPVLNKADPHVKFAWYFLYYVGD